MTANLGFSIFLLAMAVFMVMMTSRMLLADKENVRLSAASLAWPTVQGLVSSIFVANIGTEESSSYEPRTNYAYAVGGRDYVGTRIAFIRLQFSSKKKADAVAANYTSGLKVPVAYDPADPQNSVLDRATRPASVSFYTAVMGVMSVIIALLGVGMLFIPL